MAEEVREVQPEDDPLARMVAGAVERFRTEMREMGKDPDKMGAVIFLLEDMTTQETDAVVCHAEPDNAPELAPLHMALDGTRALAEGLGVKVSILPVPGGFQKGQG